MTYKEAIKSLEELKCYLPSEFTEKTTSYTEALNIAIKVLEQYSEKPPHLMPCICGRKRPNVAGIMLTVDGHINASIVVADQNLSKSAKTSTRRGI